MADEFVTFQRFNDKAAVLALANLFKENNIDYLLEDASANFDVSFAYNEIDKDYRIKLRPDSFDRANQLLQDNASKDLALIDSSYYLFDFTDKELIEVVEKQDEWSAFDFLLVQKLLKERGITISSEEVKALKTERIAQLATPEKSPKFLIFLGYVLAFLGGLLAILIGWYIKNHQKTLPNGERVYNYSQKDRIHGERIIILGIISLSIYAVIKLYEFL